MAVYRDAEQKYMRTVNTSWSTAVLNREDDLVNYVEFRDMMLAEGCTMREYVDNGVIYGFFIDSRIVLDKKELGIG